MTGAHVAPSATTDPGASRRALLVVLACTLLTAAYVFSFVFAQSTPSPQGVRVAVVGSQQQTRLAAKRIQKVSPGSFDVTRLRRPRAARRAIRHRKVEAALVLGAVPRLLTSPPLGMALKQAVTMELPKAAGLTAKPMSAKVGHLVGPDRGGTALDLMVFVLVIVGVVMPLLTTVMAAALPVRSRLFGLALFSLLGGLAAAAVINVALNALPGSFLAIAGWCVLLLLALTTTTQACIALLGPPGVLLAILVFLVIGNVASGALVVYDLLPGFWRVVGPYLPPGAGADVLRDTAYFPGADLLRPILVLAGFALGGTLGSAALGDRRPAAQGSPDGPAADQSAVQAG